jgi:hypothetical protein
MKANKALKRLTKIETLISDLTARYSPTAPRIRGVLEDAKAAVARAKEALSLQAVAKADRGAKKAAPARKKAAVKKAAAKATIAKSAKKSSPIKKAAKKKAATMTASAAVHAAPEAAGTSASIGEVERATGTGFLANTLE